MRIKYKINIKCEFIEKFNIEFVLGDSMKTCHIKNSSTKIVNYQIEDNDTAEEDWKNSNINERSSQ